MKILKDILMSMALLALAYYVSLVLEFQTTEVNNSPMIFALAVLFISRFTDGYVYGIIASFVSVFAINVFFMYPYHEFSLSIAGYPVAVTALVISSILVSALTSRMKKQIKQNQELYEAQTKIKIESEKEKTRSNLLRAISHDIRTPLTSIYGFGAFMEMNAEGMSADEIRKTAGDIREESQELMNMVENLLSVTQVNEAGIKLKKTDEIFEEVVTVAIARIKASYSDATILFEAPDEILLVPMDQMLIQQVIFNLVENSLRHADANKTVELRLYRKDTLAVLEVTDHGKGLPCSGIDELIGSVQRNEEIAADATRGSGLGLSVCRSIIKAHGGYLEAENLESGGACFRFGLFIKEMLDYEQ